MSTHTPGPWSITTQNLRGGKFWVVHLGTHLETVDIHEDDNGQANARLIAAAPELLEALKDLLNDCINFDGGKLTEVFQVKATRAIAKAEGRE